MANTREKHKLSRWGCIAWLGDLLIAESLVHGKAAEVSATALDALLAVELEAVAVEERSCGQTGKSGNPRGC